MANIWRQAQKAGNGLIYLPGKHGSEGRKRLKAERAETIYGNFRHPVLHSAHRGCTVLSSHTGRFNLNQPVFSQQPSSAPVHVGASFESTVAGTVEPLYTGLLYTSPLSILVKFPVRKP